MCNDKHLKIYLQDLWGCLNFKNKFKQNNH